MNTKQKSTKQAIKTLVKECLLEILAEGLVGNNTATLQETRELRGTLQETAERLSSASPWLFRSRYRELWNSDGCRCWCSDG
jgi:hypothetical protein